MYEELIKNLRHDSASALQNCEFDFVHDWMLKAADAIEELQQITTHYEEESKGWWLAACDAKEERERLKEQLDNAEIENIKLKEDFAKYRKKYWWIPVTERLPEDRQRVLAISLSKISPRRSYYRLVYFSNNLESVDNLEFEGESRCGFYYYDSEYGFCEVDDATHWMPLPEPPKAKECE